MPRHCDQDFKILKIIGQQPLKPDIMNLQNLKALRFLGIHVAKASEEVLMLAKD